MKLKKQLRTIDVLSMAFGAIIGWGCFMLPGNLFLPKAGPLGTAIALFLGSLMIMVIASSYSYLIEKIPGAGGEFNYIKTAFGKKSGYLAAWFLILAYGMIVPLNGTAIGLLFRFVAPHIFQAGKLYTIAGWDVYLGDILMSMAVITVIAFLNYRGIKKTGAIQTMVCFVLVISAIILSVMVFTADTTNLKNLRPLFQTENQKWYAGVLAIAAVSPWAFMGFDCIPQMSEEYNFPHKKAKALMYMSIIFAAFIYILINTVTAVAMPWKELIALNPEWATKDAAYFATGKTGVILLTISLLGGIISGLNSFILADSRLIYAVSLEKALPQCFSRLHPVYDTPKESIFCIWLISVIAPWFGREVLNWIVDMTSVGTALVFAYTTAAAFKISRKSGDRKQAVLSIIGCLFSICFLGLLLIPGMPGFLSTQSMIILVIWIILGIVVWFLIRKDYESEA